MLDLLVEHRAGFPLGMKLLSGHTSDANDFGDVVPATLTEAQRALESAAPAVMSPLRAGYRCQVLASTCGGVAQRWLLIYPAHRPAIPRRIGRSTSSGSNGVPTKSKCAKNSAAPRLPVKPRPSTP
jgi:hypothetical protein